MVARGPLLQAYPICARKYPQEYTQNTSGQPDLRVHLDWQLGYSNPVPQV